MREEFSIPTWFQPILDRDERPWRWHDGILVLENQEGDDFRETLEFYNQVGGVEQGRLASNPLHASYYDLPRYFELLKKALAFRSNQLKLALDLGCGDGRGTHMLLEAGFPHVIAIDFHPETLRRLVRSLKPAHRDRVVPILAPVTVPPFPGVACDFALCIEVLTTLPSPQSGAWALRRWLDEEQGVAVVIEPAVEGSLVYSMIQGDLTIAEQILTRRTRFDWIAGHSLEVALFTKESLMELLSKKGFEVLMASSMPAGAALLLLSLKRRGIEIGPKELVLLQLANSLEQFVPRMHSVVVRPV